MRGQFGVRYAQYAASGDQQRKDLARQFLEQVGGLGYIPADLRAAEIQTALQDLLTAHEGYNNFHNEPPFARRLALLMKPPAKLPSIVAEEYVRTLVRVFLTNGYGVAWNANPVYVELLSQLDAEHAIIAVLSFHDIAVASRLQFDLSQRKFRELLTIVRKIVTAPAAVELIHAIESFSGPLNQLAADSTIKRIVHNLKTILGLA